MPDVEETYHDASCQRTWGKRDPAHCRRCRQLVERDSPASSEPPRWQRGPRMAAGSWALRARVTPRRRRLTEEESDADLSARLCALVLEQITRAQCDSRTCAELVEDLTFRRARLASLIERSHGVGKEVLASGFTDLLSVIDAHIADPRILPPWSAEQVSRFVH